MSGRGSKGRSLERYAEAGFRKLQLMTTSRGLSAGRLMAAGGANHLTRPLKTPKVDTPDYLVHLPHSHPVEEAG
jgi:hypothetical protein